MNHDFIEISSLLSVALTQRVVRQRKPTVRQSAYSPASTWTTSCRQSGSTASGGRAITSLLTELTTALFLQSGAVLLGPHPLV